MSLLRLNIMLALTLPGLTLASPTMPSPGLQSRSVKGQLTDQDKFEIINDILLRTNFARDQEKGAQIYLSTRNIPDSVRERLPVIDGFNLVLVSPSEIEEKATGRVFAYYQFGEFKAKGKRVTISFARNELVSNAGRQDNVGRKYEFRKVGKRWKGRVSGITLGMS